MPSTTTSNSSDSTKVWCEKVSNDEEIKRLAILDDGREVLEIRWDKKNTTLCICYAHDEEEKEKAPMEKLKELMQRNPDALEHILTILKAE